MKNYKLYYVDSETLGTNFIKHDVIEISILRMEDNVQRTWCIKPTNISDDCEQALRINGHKLEDITWKTAYGRETYLLAEKVIVDIENWLGEDGIPAESRFIVAQNASFDLNMLQQLWIKCNSKDSFPFGRRYLDTMIIELFFDYCKNDFAEGYSLSKLVKKYGVKNERAHSAAADTKATKEVFMKQVDYFKKLLKHV
jgi:DNA polymerase III alpha subunit (gram-positive type)